MAATSQQKALFEDYDGFVEKFKPKKTTDDCYTPPEIYDVILDYVVERYGIDRDSVSRPFYQGGDYESVDYDGSIVVDNPPFSMLSRIVKFYVANDVPFFLFAPSLTCLNSIKAVFPKVCAIVGDACITYENGAVVRTAFVTNMETDGSVLISDPELGEAINAKDAELRSLKVKKNPKYEYPDNIITSAKVQWFAAHHTPYKLKASDCIPVGKIDAMGGKSIFGSGFLLSDRAAAERAAAERAAAERAAAERAAAERAAAERAAAIRWQLSERELKLVAMLG